MRSFLVDFAQDEKALWTSPARLRFRDTTWLVPLGGLTAGMFATDSEFSRHLSHDTGTISHYSTLSNAGAAALVGGAGGMWLLSHFNHDDHWRETGFLAGEAAIHSLVMTEAMKYSFRRERPYQGDGTGPFFQPGGTSFPSEHSALAWSVAGVVAHEYPGPLTKLLAYGAASMVSFSRVKAEKHFSSDVMVGALIGELAAHEIYKRHHDVELGGDTWTDPAEMFYDDGHSRPGFVGSPYVPLDSWIYPTLDRLAAMGLINSAFEGMRPWTRLACAQMVVEAEDRVDDAGPVAADLVNELADEFRPELGGGADQGETSFRLASVYSRTQYISGLPLTDGYDLAQTEINDYGRPYGEGWNSVNGFSVYAAHGPWVTYFRGELQTSPSIPALPLSARGAIEQAYENVDGFQLPLQPSAPQPSIRQLRILEAYAGLTFSNWEFSFGKQSLWWGTGKGGSLELSNNAPPINMFRINRVVPLKLPSIFGWLGPLRTEFFLGQLEGFQFIDTPTGIVGQWGTSLARQPFIHGLNISFKPTPNFEFGFYRTTIFGGEGYPFTFHSFARSLFSHGNTARAAQDKPGNRTSGLDFSYRLPHLRNWVTFYGDGYTDDQFSPIAYADRSAWHAGLYLSHLPRAHRLDLRVEGVYTDVPGGGGPIAPGTFYANGTWTSGYTNNGLLIGDWVGRGGQGAQAWSNCWFSAHDRLQINFRHQKVSQRYISGGGTLTDIAVRDDFWPRRDLGLSASVQYEKWLFPAIQPGPQSNLAATVEIQFQPQKVFLPSLHKVIRLDSGKGDSN